MTSPQVIYTGQGAIDDVTVSIDVPAGTTTGQIQVAVGGYGLPSGDWLTPDACTVTGTTATVSLRIGLGHTNPIKGTYWLWYRVNATDGRVLIEPQRTGGKFETTDPAAFPVTPQPVYVAWPITDNGDGTVTIMGGSQ